MRAPGDDPVCRLGIPRFLTAEAGFARNEVRPGARPSAGRAPGRFGEAGSAGRVPRGRRATEPAATMAATTGAAHAAPGADALGDRGGLRVARVDVVLRAVLDLVRR